MIQIARRIKNWIKETRNINQIPIMYSHERQEEDTQSSSTRKLGRRDETSRSARAGNWSEVRASKSEGHRWNSTICKVSDKRYLEVFKNLRKKLNFVEDAPVIGIEALKTNVLIWGLYVDDDESRHSSRTKLR